MGIVTLAGWAIVGLIVASVEKSRSDPRDADGAIVTMLCVAGAIVGAAVGQSFRWFVFGQPLGFVFAAVGAVSLLHLYRSQSTARRPHIDVVQHVESEAAVPAVALSTAPPSPPTPPISVATTLAKSLGWSLISAVAVAMCGYRGHLIGTTMYPQRYEGMPSDLFFFPLGLILGVVVVVMARLANPKSHALHMVAAIALASVGYGGLLYGYARSHALPTSFTVTFEPDPGVAMRCDTGAACPQANPPFEWSVEAMLRVAATNGRGATLDKISLSSSEKRPFGSRKPTREEIAEENRFDGPTIRLEGREIPGSRRIRANEVASYPIRYYYRTRTGRAERDIYLHIDFTDAAGHWAGHQALWKIR